MSKKFAYVFDVIEYERGWGKKHDGYMCFIDEPVAIKWREAEYKERDDVRETPDWYENYENGRWEPVHETIYTALLSDKTVFVKHLDKENK